MKCRSSTRNVEKNSVSVAYDTRARKTPWTSVTVRKNENVVLNSKTKV